MFFQPSVHHFFYHFEFCFNNFISNGWVNFRFSMQLYIDEENIVSDFDCCLISISCINFTLCFVFQFAQFALLTQTVAVFGTYVLGYSDSHKVKVIFYGQMIGLLVSYIALFGNEMLLTSFFASCLLTVIVSIILFN